MHVLKTTHVKPISTEVRLLDHLSPTLTVSSSLGFQAFTFITFQLRPSAGKACTPPMCNCPSPALIHFSLAGLVFSYGLGNRSTLNLPRYGIYLRLITHNFAHFKKSLLILKWEIFLFMRKIIVNVLIPVKL